MSASQETPAIVAPQVLLGNHLKALKLPTFAREYERVAMESAQDRADYPAICCACANSSASIASAATSGAGLGWHAFRKPKASIPSILLPNRH